VAPAPKDYICKCMRVALALDAQRHGGIDLNS
jgi:hypothetical protein